MDVVVLGLRRVGPNKESSRAGWGENERCWTNVGCGCGRNGDRNIPDIGGVKNTKINNFFLKLCRVPQTLHHFKNMFLISHKLVYTFLLPQQFN